MTQTELNIWLLYHIEIKSTWR